MRALARLPAACLAGALGLTAGCHDGLLRPAADAGPADLTLNMATNASSGTADAYSHADGVVVRLRSGDELRLDELLAFDPSGTETRVALHVPLRGSSETMVLDLELRAGAEPLFRGEAPVTLSVGRTTTVPVRLEAVISAVSCAGETIELSYYGDTATVAATAFFASGHVVDDAAIHWSADPGSVVRVDPVGPRTARVTALSDGQAQVTCFAQGATDSRTVVVSVPVRSVEVNPADQSVLVGQTAAFTVTLRDARDNIITGRQVDWVSGTPVVASTSTEGVATGLAAGTTIIQASSDGTSGSAILTVVSPIPTVDTAPPTSVSGEAATFNGTVNPNGLATEAWFEYGLTPSLSRAVQTPARPIGSDTSPADFFESLEGLEPSRNYWVRIAASNIGGTARGEILRFRTGRDVEAATPYVEAWSAALSATVPWSHTF